LEAGERRFEVDDLKFGGSFMRRPSLLVTAGEYDLELIDEPVSIPPSAHDVASYYIEYYFNHRGGRPSSRHGLVLRDGGVVRQSCLVLAGGGPTTVHEHSMAIVGAACFVAVGDTLCSLALPTLDLLWRRQVDCATCFGVYYLAKHDCLISHGELEIVRLALSGEVAWTAAGTDIFTEGIEIRDDHVAAVDFNRSVYRFDLATGASSK
jgi:hypothetical protein